MKLFKAVLHLCVEMVADPASPGSLKLPEFLALCLGFHGPNVHTGLQTGHFCTEIDH